MHYRFGGLIFGGAFTWRGLFSEFYGIILPWNQKFVNYNLSPTLITLRPPCHYNCLEKHFIVFLIYQTRGTLFITGSDDETRIVNSTQSGVFLTNRPM